MIKKTIMVFGLLSGLLMVSADEMVFQQQILTINQVPLEVELAQTEAQRSRGLMQRQTLGEGQGMLFIFEQEALPCFWMKNTLIPLSIAYISAQNRIIQIEPLMPEDESMVCAKEPVRYALEVPQGWFEKQQIKKGDEVQGLLTE